MKFVFESAHTPFGTIYTLDLGTLTDAEYDRVKPVIEFLNGHWSERLHRFVFRTDVSRELAVLLKTGIETSEKYRYQERTQFYPTPVSVAKRTVDLCDIRPGMKVLEPSAGKGRLVDQIAVSCEITCVEPMPENSSVLRGKGYRTFELFFEDFAETCGTFDRIVMNPPFSQQRDALHVMLAYRLLRKGGILTAIVSENSLYYQTDISDLFRCFLCDVDAEIEPIPFSAFEESGTMIDTVIIRIVKK